MPKLLSKLIVADGQSWGPPVLLLLTIVVAILPFWVVSVPPSTDLPQHLSQIFLFEETLAGNRPELIVTPWYYPNTLVYGLAGYSGVTLRSVSYDLFGITGTGPTPQYYGATFGGGFERYFTDTISARAEYRGTHLQTRDNLIAPGWTNLSAGGTVHTLRGVVSYRIPAL